MEEFDISVKSQWIGYSLLYFASIFISLMLPDILHPIPLLIPYSYLLLDSSRKIPKLTLIFTFFPHLIVGGLSIKNTKKLPKLYPQNLLRLQFLVIICDICLFLFLIFTL